ncbi:MAG: hypothetical protein U9532_00150 ['Conium maculatum' witches'-broom phytoplasma]|nr:hypothetical protein ['Conium maculatum' witches'-broom phytoplasma]
MNFLKKHWVVILIILFFSTVIIIGFFKVIHEAKQEKKSLSNYHEELEDDKESNQSSRTKSDIEELPKSKIKITQANYDKIKSYILSENEHEILPFNNLLPEEITENNKIKNNWNLLLETFKHDKKTINEYQQKFDIYNKQISELDDKKDEIEIKALNSQLNLAEKSKNREQKNYDKRFLVEKNSILHSLNSLYEITPSEG